MITIIVLDQVTQRNQTVVRLGGNQSLGRKPNGGSLGRVVGSAESTRPVQVVLTEVSRSVLLAMTGADLL